MENVLAQLRIEYIESSSDPLDLIDQQIQYLFNSDEDWQDRFIEFQRQIHSLKGTAGSYGFHSVSEITHSLEDYLETSINLTAKELSDIQAYVDQTRWILESGKEPAESETAEILRKLPAPNKSSFSTQEIRHIPVLLVMPYNIQRKIVASELVSCGFRVYMADTGVRAIELALIHQPTIVISNYDIGDMTGRDLAFAFSAIEATKKINFGLMTSNEGDDARFADLPDGIKILRKGEFFSEDLAECLLNWRVFIKDARESKAKQERSHLRVNFDGGVTVFQGDAELRGSVVDISGGGISVRFPPETSALDAAIERGGVVTLNVDELSTISGRIVRVDTNEIAVRFDIDQKLEDRLLAEIMVITNHLGEVALDGSKKL